MAERMEWTVNFGKQAGRKRLLVVAVAIMCALLGLTMFRSPIVALVALIIVFAACSEAFLPCRYRLEQKGATSKIGFSESFIAWSDVKRELEDEDGVRLSPLEKESRLDSFRGVYLRTPGNRDLVLSTIRQFRQSDGIDNT